MTVELDTERLRLRPLQESDHEPLSEFYSDPELTRYLEGTADSAAAWHWLLGAIGHWTVRGFGYFALEERASGNVCGAAGLIKHFDWPELEIGWRVFRGFHGRGYATEAARRIREEAFNFLGATSLVSYIDPGNTQSIRVAERLEAKHDSTIILRGRQTEVYRHPQPEARM